MTEPSPRPRSRRRLRHRVLAVVAGAAMLGTTATAVGAQVDEPVDTFVAAESSVERTGSAALDFVTVCPQMSDSLYRLYTAYFLRDPDDAGWDYWLDTYGVEPGANLDIVSSAFASSQEFQNTYGSLSNEDFVTLVYRNVTEREPDAAGFEHWVTSLNNGYPRGSVMIAFSESQEYVNKTSSVGPLAGYLMWYDSAVQFGCGVGPISGSPKALDSTPHLDFLAFGVADVTIRVRLVRGDNTRLDREIALQPADIYIVWNTDYDPARDTLILEVLAGEPDDVAWSVVTYDEPHAEGRPGWTD